MNLLGFRFFWFPPEYVVNVCEMCQVARRLHTVYNRASTKEVFCPRINEMAKASGAAQRLRTTPLTAGIGLVLFQKEERS